MLQATGTSGKAMRTAAVSLGKCGEESTIEQMETYAAQDLKELFESVSRTSDKLARWADKLARWAVQTINELVTSTVLHTTRIHNERLVDRCRRVEVYTAVSLKTEGTSRWEAYAVMQHPVKLQCLTDD